MHWTGVLGWPLTYTLSPTIHNAAFEALGLEWIYLAWPVSPTELETAVAGLRALGAAGANVTMPHKESVIQWLDGLSGDADAVEAVNTIQRTGDRFVGHNTDVDGFREFLTADAGFDATGKRALVLGSGGGARAVVKALDDLGCSAITIAARRGERGKRLTGVARHAKTKFAAWRKAERLAREVDLVVNATPIGIGAATEGPAVLGRSAVQAPADALEDPPGVGPAADTPLPGVVFSPGQTVVDLIYDPPSTPLVEQARSGGAHGWGGIGMLVHQAAASFRIWTGLEAPIETMSAAAVHAIGGHHAEPRRRSH